MILIIGGTGTNGREVIDRLVAAGEPTRALVRDAKGSDDLRAKGVEVVVGDLDDPASLDRAFAGADRAFFLAAVDERMGRWFDNFLGAATRSGKPRVVKFSGMGADPASSTTLLRIHGEADRSLIGSGLPYTIIRPNSFHQNLLWSAATIRSSSEFYLPVGDAHQSLIDVRDIAAVAATVLTQPGHEGQIHEVTGPESLTYHQVADRLAAAIGRPVRYVPVPPDAALASMLSSGMPAWNARAVSDLYTVFAAGLAAETTDTVARVTGKPPIPFAQFARDHADAFR